MEQTIQLKTESIKFIPIDKYNQDFTFIVNDQEYHTSRLVADLLSKKVSQLHFTDPISDKIYINTRTKGDFNHFLSLQNFNVNQMTDEDIKFIFEIATQLETTNIDVKVKREEITIDNVINRLLADEQFSEFYSKEIETEIEFVSTNFSELSSQQKDQMKNLSVCTLERILKNDELEVESEDEVLKFVNDLYRYDDKYSILYSWVYFENVESESIKEFIDIFEFDIMTASTWKSISTRLIQKVLTDKEKVRHRKKEEESTKENRPTKTIEYNGNHYEGIIEYFRKESNVNDEVKITASSTCQDDLNKVLQKDFPTNNDFATNNSRDSWICIEFKNHQVIPTNYTIRSNNWGANDPHPRNWVIEGRSSDSTEWEIIDEQKENSSLNGSNRVITLPIQNQKQNKFKYIRIRQTGVNWKNNNYLGLNYIEIFGNIF